MNRLWARMSAHSKRLVKNPNPRRQRGNDETRAICILHKGKQMIEGGSTHLPPRAGRGQEGGRRSAPHTQVCLSFTRCRGAAARPSLRAPPPCWWFGGLSVGWLVAAGCCSGRWQRGAPFSAVGAGARPRLATDGQRRRRGESARPAGHGHHSHAPLLQTQMHAKRRYNPEQTQRRQSSRHRAVAQRDARRRRPVLRAPAPPAALEAVRRKHRVERAAALDAQQVGVLRLLALAALL